MTAVLLVAMGVLVIAGWGPAGGILFGFVLLTPLERLFRRHRQPVRRRGLRTDIVHALFSGALTTVCLLVPVVLWALHLFPLIELAQPSLFGRQPVVLQAVEAFVLFEFFGYWVHRAMHEVGFLWRFHAIHHSSTTLDWISGARVHPVEGAVIGALVAPPLLLLGIHAPTVGALSVLTALWGTLLHANIRWRFRWMDGWWGTPELHHWHHSSHPEARNANYAAFLPVFDRLFGTYYQPEDRRPCDYGTDEEVPDGWFAQLAHPFRRRSRARWETDRKVPVSPRSALDAPFLSGVRLVT